MKALVLIVLGSILSLSANAGTHKIYTYVTEDSKNNEVKAKAAVIFDSKNVPKKIILPEFDAYRSQSGEFKPFSKSIPLKQKANDEKLGGYDLALEDVLTQEEVGNGQIAIYSQFNRSTRLIGGVLVSSQKDIEMILSEFRKILTDQNDDGEGLKAFNKRCPDQTELVLLPFIGDLPAVIPLCFNK